MGHFGCFWEYRKWHLGCPNQNSKTTFGHFIDFGHFPIEIPIEANKFYGKWKEGSYIKNKNSFEISEQNGTTCRYVQVKKRKKSE